MADYGINIVDNGNNTFTISVLQRNPTTKSSGGTNLLTNTYAQNAATGGLTSASGFLDTATDLGDGLGHTLSNPIDGIERAMQIIRNDRAFNG